MKLLKELMEVALMEEEKKSSVAKSTRAAVYHADYVKTKKKKYRKYHPTPSSSE